MSRFLAIFLLAFVVLTPTATFAQSSKSYFTRYFEPTHGGEAAEREAGESEPEEEPDEIETDRDSYTPATTLVGRRRIVVESAYSFIDNRRVLETHSLPELLVRYGVTDRLELRFGVNYEVGGAGNPISASVPDDFEEDPHLEEEASISYGFKYALTEQRNSVPRSAVVIRAATPTAGELTATHVAATYVYGWTLDNGWTWDSAFRYGIGSERGDHFNIWSPSTVVKVPVGDRYKAHLEYFGVFSDGRAHESVQHFISPGVHYLITPDLEIGIRFGWGLNEQSPNFFANVGGGYRF